jgi:DNA-binding response OmpR family regulator
MNQIILNKRTYSIERLSKSVALTRREFELLDLLATTQGQTFSKEQIVREVFPKPVFENSVEVYVKYLRIKIARITDDEVLATRRGFGYLVNANSILVLDREDKPKTEN